MCGGSNGQKLKKTEDRRLLPVFMVDYSRFEKMDVSDDEATPVIPSTDSDQKGTHLCSVASCWVVSCMLDASSLMWLGCGDFGSRKSVEGVCKLPQVWCKATVHQVSKSCVLQPRVSGAVAAAYCVLMTWPIVRSRLSRLVCQHSDGFHRHFGLFYMDVVL